MRVVIRGTKGNATIGFNSLGGDRRLQGDPERLNHSVVRPSWRTPSPGFNRGYAHSRPPASENGVSGLRFEAFGLGHGGPDSLFAGEVRGLRLDKVG